MAALLLPCFLVFTTCGDDDIPADTVETSDVTDITMTSATLYGRVDPYYMANGATVGFILSTSPNPSLSNGQDLRAMEIDPKNRFFVEVKDLEMGTTYYFKAYLNTGTYKTGLVKEFTTEDLAVDLGLSVKWASCNLGAKAPEESGDFFAWGETEPKNKFSWSTYKWGDWPCSKYNKKDKKQVLDSEDDAAHVILGGKWRMPTTQEQEELRDECLWQWTSLNGVTGYKITSKKNGKSIFLPAAGYRIHDYYKLSGEAGRYWSAVTEDNEDAYAANNLQIDSDGVYVGYNGYWSQSWPRDEGLSIRPVCN